MRQCELIIVLHYRAEPQLLLPWPKGPTRPGSTSGVVGLRVVEKRIINVIGSELRGFGCLLLFLIKLIKYAGSSYSEALKDCFWTLIVANCPAQFIYYYFQCIEFCTLNKTDKLSHPLRIREVTSPWLWDTYAMGSEGLIREGYQADWTIGNTEMINDTLLLPGLPKRQSLI